MKVLQDANPAESVHGCVVIKVIDAATAAIAALSVSGLPTDSFVFEGFLPSKPTARRRRLEELKDEMRTLVFYEAPHRVLATLKDMFEILDERQAVVTRVLTKVHEETIRGSLSEVLDELTIGTIKGKFTIVVHGATDRPAEQHLDTADHLRNLMLHRGLSMKEATPSRPKSLDCRRSNSIRQA